MPSSDEKYPALSGIIINCRSFYLYKDKFERAWKLIPVNNPAIEMPFIIKPLPIEEYNQIVHEIFTKGKF